MSSKVGFSSRSEESQPPEPAPRPKLTPEKLKQIRQAAEAQIDAFLKAVGIANPSIDARGWRYINRGSASGRAAILESDGELYMRVEAHVMPMPSDRDLILPLMRELLELNMRVSGAARLGIDGDSVFVSNTRPILELRSGDFAEMIHTTMGMADELDDELVKKYGGTTQPRARATTGEPPWSGGTPPTPEPGKGYGSNAQLRKRGKPVDK